MPDLLVPMFWAAPETLASLERRARCQVLALSELIPDLAIVLEETYRIAYAIASGSPAYRGVLPLLGFETVLADALLPHVIAARLVDELTRRGEAGELVVGDAGPWAAPLLAASRQGNLRVRIHPGTRAGAPSLRSRIADAALDAFAERDWRRLIAQPIEHLGPRFRRHRPQRLSGGGTWCYASYVNYSRALARHHPQGARWLVNGRSGAAGVPAAEPLGHLWDVARPASQRVHGTAARDILAHIASQWPSREGPRVESMILGTLAEVDLFTAFIDRYAPGEIWVGNQWGGEGTLIQVAHRAGIPVTQVQHGALEAHFRWANLASDRFLVWGKAWRSGLPEASRRVTEVLNPGIPLLASSAGDHKGESRTVFLSAPANQPLWDPAGARQEAASILGGVAKGGGRIVARVHPADATRSWTASLAEAGAEPERVDKGTPLGRSLAGATAALTFRSTVFMDCIAARIPVVALGWYPWAWDEEVREFGAMTLAASTAEATEACLSPVGIRPDISPWLAEPG